MQIRNKKYLQINGEKLRVGIVVARFNKEFTDALLVNALDALEKCKVSDKNIRVVSVAGVVEIPYILQKLAITKKFDFLVALGCVIKGKTPHFDYVCKMAQEGILKVMLDKNIPISFGVLTVNNEKQAKERLHVGKEAALAALESALIK